MAKSKKEFEGLNFIPLGGSEQFGVNLNVYECDDDYLVVDMGIGFADENFPGIDILLPNPKYLEGHKKKISGLIITHAHEDHIGAVAHLWPRLKCPIYCTRFTAEILKKKMAEEPACKKAPIVVVDMGATIQIGTYVVQFIPVTHSVPETASLFVKTKYGNVLHSGDWNLDPTPVLGVPTSEKTFREIGKQGVLAYIGDSTNANVAGRSGSEMNVQKGLAEVIKENDKGAIVITIFSSNIGRIHSICKAAEANGRSVGLVGRSLHRMVGAAKTCGYLNDIQDFVNEDDLELLPRENIVIIATGSQGEARAQMARIARGDSQFYRIKRGDTVIFSSRAIPGNEKNIYGVQNNLAAAGVKIITTSQTSHCIHVSGHPCRDEIVEMLDWLKPQLVIPVHGERVMLEAHAKLAQMCQVPQTIIPNNGSVIHLAPHTPEIIDHVTTGVLAVEPGRIIDGGHKAIAERRKLQYSGAIHASLVLDKNLEFLSDPHISTQGLIDEDSDEGMDFEDEMFNEIDDVLRDLKKGKNKTEEFVAEEIRIALRRYANNVLKMKPKTDVHVSII
ncbi:MAG: ribonuclease J [Alphaproteobacteria bacterium]|nr:ribonuclease J [Alphaproteobacteria bacterium]NCQ88085.1 ribonuclease J [Alphaproteobacteria bacterium]NCT05408.1 ribonuclease J [Alphaproteobacteria bacterium]